MGIVLGINTSIFILSPAVCIGFKSDFYWFEERLSDISIIIILPAFPTFCGIAAGVQTYDPIFHVSVEVNFDGGISNTK